MTPPLVFRMPRSSHRLHLHIWDPGCWREHPNLICKTQRRNCLHAIVSVPIFQKDCKRRLGQKFFHLHLVSHLRTSHQVLTPQCLHSPGGGQHRSTSNSQFAKSLSQTRHPSSWRLRPGGLVGQKWPNSQAVLVRARHLEATRKQSMGSTWIWKSCDVLQCNVTCLSHHIDW